MKKPMILIPLLLVVAILAIVGLASNEGDEKRYTGIVEADSIVISAEVGGNVTGVFVDEGQSVREGDLMISLEDEALKIEKEKIEGLIRISELQYESMKDGARSQEIDGALNEVRAMESRVAAAAEDYRLAKDAFDDRRILYEAGGISASAYEAAESNMLKAEDNLNALRQQKSKASSAMELLVEGADEKSLAMAHEELLLKRVELKAVMNKIDKTSFEAPKTGSLREILVSEGELVFPGTKVAVIDEPTYHIKFFIPEKDLDSLHVGDSITMDFEGREIETEITFVSDSGEFTPKNIESSESKEEIVFRARAELEQSPDWIKPGMFVDVSWGDEE
ncbi:MAG TPA: biotin/lipoyl-binding protein [Clostridia bacterium]|nr:biotin/lipoyl-binding protein [Clostridia bacterium]